MNVKICPPYGPLNARICVIGEAPAESELMHSPPRPFVGTDGHKLKTLLKDAGIDPDSVRYDNVMQTLPPGACRTTKDYNPALFRTIELVEGVFKLRDRLEQLRNVNVYVPLGNYATYALTGLGRVKPALRKYFIESGLFQKPETTAEIGISKLRGSVYEFNGRKVIPTLHPGALRHSPHTRHPETAVRMDWDFIRVQSKFSEIEKRPLVIYDPEEYPKIPGMLAHPKRPLAIDIETWSGNIDCVGFAWSERDAIVLPTYNVETRKKYIAYIKAACESGCEKILQNGLFDAYWLNRSWNIDINNYKWDTLGMHHALDPIQDHSLNHLASLYTFPRLNYWKDESKNASELRKYAKTRERVFEYNAKDTTVTWEICHRLKEKLGREGVDFYLRYYARLHKPLLKMMLRGWKVDTEAQLKMLGNRKAQCEAIRKRLNAYAGFELYSEKDISPKKLKTFLVDILGMSPFKAFGKETFDEKALLAMQRKEPLKAGPVIAKILEHRHLAKECEKLNHTWHPDGRVRYSYHYRTEAGRLGSSKAYDGYGMNIQNVKR